MIHRRPIVPVIAAAMFLTSGAGASILYVDQDALPNGDGTSWRTAYNSLVDALDDAALSPSVDAIWVAAGIHHPIQGSPSRSDRFQLVANVEILGGFQGDETSADQRDPETFITILSGDFNGNDSVSDTDGDGLVEFSGNGENALQVIVGEGVTNFRVSGFVIEGGNANFDGAELRGGGGMFLHESDGVIDQCLFRHNTAGIEEPDIGGFGGGVFILGGHVDVLDCVFEDNRAMNGGAIGINSRPDFTNYLEVDVRLEGCTIRRCFSDYQTGGAIWSATGDPLNQTVDGQIVAQDCTFEDCFAQHHAAWTDQNTPHLLVEDCTFRGNEALGFGGAFSHGQSAGPDLEMAMVRRCVFEGNVASSIGAAILIQATNIAFESCFIRNNSGDSIVRNGPVIGFQGGARDLFMTNCLIANNQGIGILTDGVPLLHVSNTTVARNMALDQGVASGGLVADIDASHHMVVLDNSIFHGNRGLSDGEAGQIQVLDGAPTINFCLVEDWSGGFGGLGNLGGDPGFVDPGAGDYRLTSGSPAVDSADNTRVPEGVELDLDGLPRFVDDPNTPDTGIGPPPIADRGPFELQRPCPADFDASGAVGVDDLLILLAAWGECTSPCARDLDDDGFVDVNDLLELLASWGPCGEV